MFQSEQQEFEAKEAGASEQKQMSGGACEAYRERNELEENFVRDTTESMPSLDFMLFRLWNALNQATTSTDEEIILVIGMTGKGKSTLIAKLMGAPLRERRLNHGTRKIFIDAADTSRYPKIGQSIVSCTDYPVIFQASIQSQGFQFCDTAGFGDNRGYEYDLISYLVLKNQIERNIKGKIKGIIVVFNEYDFRDHKGSDFLRLLDILDSIIGDPAVLSSALFVINNLSGNYELEDNIGCIRDMERDLGQNLRGTTDQRKLRILRKICRVVGTRNVHHFNPQDNGECATKVHEFFTRRAHVSVEGKKLRLSIDSPLYRWMQSEVIRVAQFYLEKSELNENAKENINSIETKLNTLISEKRAQILRRRTEIELQIANADHTALMQRISPQTLDENDLPSKAELYEQQSENQLKLYEVNDEIGECQRQLNEALTHQFSVEMELSDRLHHFRQIMCLSQFVKFDDTNVQQFETSFSQEHPDQEITYDHPARIYVDAMTGRYGLHGQIPTQPTVQPPSPPSGAS